MSEICFILNKDSQEWPDYICSIFQNPAKFKFQKEFDADLARVPSPKHSASRTTVVILSHGHLDFLISNPTFSYKLLVPDEKNAILFQLGVDSENLKKVSNRFPNFKNWNCFDHERSMDMVHHLERRKPPVLPPSAIKFRLIPDTARSEDPTTITISFEEQIARTAAEAKVEVLLCEDVSSGLTIVLPAERINPFTFTFVTPEHRAGEVSIRVLVNGKTAGTSSLSFVSNSDKYCSLSQIYVHMLTKLFGLLTKNRVSVTDVDACLSSLFELDSATDIPVEAFELLFGVYRYSTDDKFDAELPTLLHFSAKHGLKELTSKLTDLPDASVAHGILNADGKRPEHLAKINKHSSLTTFLENFREVNEGMEDLYVKCHGYINVGGPQANVDLSGYIKAKNRLLGPNPAADYIVLQPSEVEDDMENGEEDQYYIYVPSTRGPAAKNKPPQEPSPPKRPPSRMPAAAAVPAAAAAAARGTTLAGNQQQLVNIIDLYKNKKCSMAEVEALFNQWKLQYQGGTSSKSFRDKQEKLLKMKEDMASAIKQQLPLQSSNQPQKGDPSAPALPPRR